MRGSLSTQRQVWRGDYRATGLLDDNTFAPPVFGRPRAGSGDQTTAMLFHQAAHEWPTPEHKLIAAVVEDAAYLLREYGRRPPASQRKLVSDAYEWVADRKSSGVFSLRWCCVELGLSYDYVRKGMLALVTDAAA